MEDIHRYILQSFMSRGILYVKEVKELYENACRIYNVPCDQYVQQLQDAIIHINKHIRPLSLEIKKAVCEETGRSSYVLVNMLDSPIVRLASEYTELEYDLFKQLVDAVVESEEGSVRSIELMNKTLKPSAVEPLLQRLQQAKWIVCTAGRVSLGTRAICELEPYIRETFRNYPLDCDVCKKLCIRGQVCTSISCDVRMHHHCAAKMFAGIENALCTGENCKTPWPKNARKEQTDDATQEPTAKKSRTDGETEKGDTERMEKSRTDDTADVME